jgi:hypothetical protein
LHPLDYLPPPFAIFFFWHGRGLLRQSYLFPKLSMCVWVCRIFRSMCQLSYWINLPNLI